MSFRVSLWGAKKSNKGATKETIVDNLAGAIDTAERWAEDTADTFGSVFDELSGEVVHRTKRGPKLKRRRQNE
jgi:hypothetical protein